jgi:Saxitoxin biosynthesis operon protein SxtJ
VRVVKVATLPFFQHVKWQPDTKELRRFSIAMLIGFFLLGLLSVLRASGIGTGSIVLWSIGFVLAVTALVPKVGRISYLAVYLPTSILGYVVSNVLLAIMFFLVITPLGLFLKLIGKDLLRQKRPRCESQWMPVKEAKNEDSYYRQF